MFANLTVNPANALPALDGSLAGWVDAVPATMAVDGLNVDGPAHIEMRLLHSAAEDAIFVHMTVNQSLTGWPIVPTHLEPASRMFIHSRAATTCSMYIRGNVSSAPSPDVTSVPTREPGAAMRPSFTPPWQNQLLTSPVGSTHHHPQQQLQPPKTLQELPTRKPDSKPGDARLVFGLFNDTSLNGGNAAIGVAVLGVYPFWDPSLGPASPATYAAGTGTMVYANVQLLKGLKTGFKLSDDGSLMSLAVQIPRSAVPHLPKFGAHFITGGDFSCNIQGFEKDWWVNADLQASQITWDEPSEANFYPASWGNFSFEMT